MHPPLVCTNPETSLKHHLNRKGCRPAFVQPRRIWAPLNARTIKRGNREVAMVLRKEKNYGDDFYRARTQPYKRGPTVTRVPQSCSGFPRLIPGSQPPLSSEGKAPYPRTMSVSQRCFISLPLTQVPEIKSDCATKLSPLFQRPRAEDSWPCRFAEWTGPSMQ